MSEATLTRYRDLLLAPGVRRAILARTGQLILHDPAPTLARIKVPTLLLWGEKDAMIPISNAAGYLRDLPNATLVRLPNLGHVPFEEDPGRLPGPAGALSGRRHTLNLNSSRRRHQRRPELRRRTCSLDGRTPDEAYFDPKSGGGGLNFRRSKLILRSKQ